MIDSVVYLVEEHVDLGGSQFSESIVERWYSAHASQQNVVTLEFGSPCSPRSALFAHDSNRHGQPRVSPFFHEVFHLPRWMYRFHDKNVFDNHLAHFLCLFQQRVSPFFHVPFQREDPYCLQWDVLGFHSFQQRVSPFFFEETVSSWKELTSISWERNVCLPSCTVLVSSSTTGLSVLSRLGFGIGWFDWKILDCCPTTGRWACSEPNSLSHLCFKDILDGGRGVTSVRSRIWLLQFSV